ncbi:MAG: pyrroline-5-carboxylate reductase [Candidatus Tantalella remota]|nr:pyrroline-5-carboxylate reductase [Candidatus Tantalella remota]
MNNIIIGIIGCGNMGGAIARGIVKHGLLPAGSVFLYDKDTARMDALSDETGCSRGVLTQMVRGSDILIIAVKPQNAEELLSAIGGDITSQTVVSVMAGVTIETIEDKLGKGTPVARTMPNMGAFVGEAITGIAFNGAVKLTEEVNAIFSGIGKVVDVDESLMDEVTALSGSGPAYLFFLADAMMAAAEEMGFAPETARELISQTLFGAANILRDSKVPHGEMISRVASKGGTTEAALSVLEDKGVKDAIKAAIIKARDRSRELSRGE